jgi:transcriptional regulator with GAF, ATPase, and Fis domain
MSYPAHNFVGESSALADVIAFIGKVARSKRTVLIEGESGTGKELAAEAIHRNSGRAGRCVAVNCAGMSEDLLENELFGHEPEAFTGAAKRRTGKFDEADKGTLFLDEVGEMSLRVQAKLLRALEYCEFQRVGGGPTIQVDIRIVAATNRDLNAAVKEGAFRFDLYQRLNVLTLKMPPLRERRSDIPILADAFIKRYAAEEGKAPAQLSPEAQSLLYDYSWPGNVRELFHVIERAAALASGDTIEACDLQIEKPMEPPGAGRESRETMEAGGLDHALYRFKRDYVANVIAATSGNLTKAAQILKKHPRGLARLLDSLDLSHLKHSPRDRFGTA